MLDLLAPRSAEFFGVQPLNDSWHAIERVLPLHRIETQEVCKRALSPALTSFYSCSSHGRPSALGGCMSNFVQELCDLQHCERMIDARERERGRSFDVILRLRADMFWEKRIRLPHPMPHATLIVPWLEPGGGFNDHIAVGDRIAMRSYLSRGRYLDRADVLNATNDVHPQLLCGPREFYSLGRNGKMRITSEGFLAAVLHHDGITRVEQWLDWAYCIFTKRSLLDQRGLFGCIARMRTRTSCASLVCDKNNLKYWCNCYNVSCAAIRSETVPNAFKVGPFETARLKPSVSKALRQARTTNCVDVDARSQLLLRSGGVVDRGLQPAGERAAACPWAKHDFGRFRYQVVRRAANCSVINSTRWF